ncbi:MAG: DNA polymerase III subunit delta' [Atopostipes sp.]|nr:DNA polymerase III subunit delta' [Atopostipes sp.]
MSSIREKQSKISSLFVKMNQKQQLQHAYIFEGARGVGKYDMAKWISQMIYCQNLTDEGEPCLECNQCQRIENEEHPDVVTMRPDGASIKVRQVREIKEEFSKSGMESRKKILIIKEMDKMTPSGANSLLKFIEEPEGEITIILLTTEVQKLLPTIVSRCQTIHFQTTNIESRIASIKAEDIPEEFATILAYLTQDSKVAREIYEDEDFKKIIQTVWQWFVLLNKNNNQAFIYVHTNIMPLAKNKEESNLLLNLLLILYRDLMALTFEQEHLTAFSKYESQLKNMIDHSIQKNISKILVSILDAQKKLSNHVAAQGLFEQIVLEIKKMSQ